jgi:hypothetical protein
VPANTNDGIRFVKPARTNLPRCDLSAIDVQAGCSLGFLRGTGPTEEFGFSTVTTNSSAGRDSRSDRRNYRKRSSFS